MATRSFSILSTLLLCVAAGLGGLARAQEAERPELPAVPTAVREAMMRGEYAVAAARLLELEAGEAVHADSWRYLRALALSLGGEKREAVDLLAGLEREFPESSWLHKARFQRATILHELRRHEEAEAIFEEEARRLRSAGRQDELAANYLEFADELSTEPESPTPGKGELDYAKAWVLYQKVLELDAPAATRQQALFRMGLCVQELGRWNDAIRDFGRWLAEFGPEAKEAEPVAGLRAFDAAHRLASARLSAGHLVDARRGFEDLSVDIGRALDGDGAWAALLAGVGADELGELRRLDGTCRFELARTYVAPEQAMAVAALERFLERFPAHPKASPAAFRIGELYLEMGRHEDCAAAFVAFLERAAPDTEDEEVREEDARLRMRALFLRGQVAMVQKRYGEAAALFAKYAGLHSTGPDWAEAQRGIVESEYLVGASHRARQEFEEARAAWLGFLERHPLDARAAAILFDLGQMRAEAAGLLEEEEDAEGAGQLFERALADWERVVAKYPRSEQASQALFRMGEVQETKLKDLEAAIEAFRRCDFGGWSGHARARLEVMTEPSLALWTERTWRTDEAARVKVQVRNVEELEVQIFELDLEAYFRKHLTHERVEELDLDLIAADRTIEVAVEGFARYAPIEQEIDLGVEGPGVWAVAVTAKEQRATTLVLRSDVEILVKSSRREVFAYAQDMRRGEPAQGVRVLVGLLGGEGPTVQEAVTGADGTCRLKSEELTAAGEVRVFAEREGHCASDGLGLSGLQVASGLSARGLVYTDRSVYRPGEEVSWKAVLRDVKEGAYTFEAGAPVRVEVADSQGRVFHRRHLELSALGTISGGLELASHAPTGQYAIRCQAIDGPVFSGGFLVEEFQLQKVELSVEPERVVYWRGERVEVELEARYYFGEPVADSPLRVTLPDRRVVELRTDGEGKASVGFETRDFAQEGALGVMATLTEEGISEGASVYLAVRGFAAALETSREVVLDGDAFLATVKTTGPDGKPVGREMRLSALRRESAPDGSWSEVLVEEHALETAEESGEAHRSLTLTAEKGESGHFVLRAEGSDRFGNPVLAEQHVFVSGEGDEVKLRLFADELRLEVGETALVDLHNRAGAGLALLTFEGEEILDWRVVRIGEGSNPLELEVEHEHFPNFALSASMMLGNRLFGATADFEVTRELRVTVEPSREAFAPGEEAEVRLRAVDQLGRPVEAELSVAVVDDALFERYPDRTPKIRGFFEEGARREAALRTTSSCTFSYRAQVREVAAAVVDELRRQSAAMAWDARRAQTLDVLAEVTAEDADDFFLGRAERPPALSAGVAFRLDADMEEEEFNDIIGMGGGAGGKYGGRFGGRRSLKAGGAVMIEAALARATAWWSPSVMTDADGRATVRFELPPQSTRWRVTCRGVGPGTLLGEAQATFLSRAELFVELRAPAVLTEGDRPHFSVRVHNLTGETGTAELRLRLIAGEQRTVLPVRLVLGEAPVTEHVFEAPEALPATGELRLEAEVVATLGERRLADAEVRDVRVRPFGVELADAESGVLTSRTSLWLELPAGREYAHRTLELYVGPGVDRLLIDEALGLRGPALYQSRSCCPLPTQADAASDLLGACAVLELMGRTGRAENPERGRVKERAEGLIAGLIASQRPDGAWDWTGRRGHPSPETSSRVMAALGEARELGLEVPAVTLERGVAYLRAAFRDASQQADEAKSMLVWAMAVNGEGDFGAANRLHRMRNALSPAALAYTALALCEMGREPMAAELAQLLAAKAKVALGEAERRSCRFPVEGNIAWNRSELEMTALSLLALQAALPSSDRVEAGVEHLLSHRPWAPRRAAGLCVAAIAQYRGETEPARGAMTVVVALPGEEPHPLPLTPDAVGTTVSVVVPDSVGDRVRVDLGLRGSGQPHYAAVLRGFSRDTTEQRAERFRVSFHRFEAMPPVYAGREIPVGFGALRDYRDEWVNEVEHLPLGQMVRAHLSFYVSHDSSRSMEELDYLVAEIPLPAGTTVLEGSVSGNALSHEVRGGVLAVHVGQHQHWGSIQYTLIGAVPGAFRVVPAVLRSAYEPSAMALAAGGDFEVLGRGVKSPDEYRPTPDELYHMGKAAYGAEDHELARGRLTALYDGFEKWLRPDPLREAASMLLFMAIERREASAIVRFFEVLKEKNPELTIPFEKVAIVGEAYRELEEYERALLIFRATIEETFGKDLKVAGTLEELGEFARATDALDRLWLEYPDLPSVVETWLALSDKLLTKAPVAHEDESLRRAGRDRAILAFDGIVLLQRFLTLYPEDPLAPDAGLNLVSAHLDLEDHEGAAALAGQMAELYGEPRYADAFRYTRAVAEWYLGRESVALDLLREIAEATYTDDLGNTTRSENRDLALYILGQIHHARREAQEASEYYEMVSELFADAREALAGLREKSISLEEVTAARPGEAVSLKITSRNVPEAELLVYGVDLMTLYLREKNLSEVTQVNLAGISPVLRRTVELGGGWDLREKEREVELELTEPGAYLVICRGGELHTSGLALVSELELAVVEDEVSGRLRVQASKSADGSFVRDVDVRVIGSANEDFVSGKTDPRGLFVADAIRGTSTVIARLDRKHYAFHRGTTSLAMDPGRLPEASKSLEGLELLESPQQQEYFKNVLDFNFDNQVQRQQRLQDEISRERRGVQIKQVK